MRETGRFSELPYKRVLQGCLAALLLLAPASLLRADGGVTYNDIAAGGGAGITFERAPSPARIAQRDAFDAMSPIPGVQFLDARANFSPQKAHGAPGVAVLDYDNDGDLDIYVTNGPGADNALYSNQLAQTGQVTFVDVAAAAGVAATDQDSSGVCYGDIDNDGDEDLYVLGTGEPNRMFENLGDGTFADITASAGVGGDGRHAVACSFGDVNGDGYLDVVVANTYDDWNLRIPTFTQGPDYPGMEHNYLFLNNGDDTFTDVSASSGIENVSNMSGPGLTGAAFTWAIAMADIDQDGDIDILCADNQGGPPSDRSEERGWNRLFLNDGTGHFTDVTEAAHLDVWGGYMGLDFADLNCDGYLDFFVTDLGYLNGHPSRWFLGGPGLTFTDSNAGDLKLTPFGWGTAMLDYDNDGDTDVIYHGGVDVSSLIAADNPGVILRNDGLCSAHMSWDSGAVLEDHRLRAVNGVAIGDLNEDGFDDIVSVSSFNILPLNFFPFVPFLRPPVGSPFDAVARFELGWFGGLMPGFQVFLDPGLVNGNLAVELNSGDNGNHSIKVRTVGTVGITSGGVANRDGIGAVIKVTPAGGPTSTRPVVGGSSYASENDLTIGFGLGQAASATVDVMWPGGVHNRLYNVQAGDRVSFPEIPCSYDADWGKFNDYQQCVNDALDELLGAGVLDINQRGRWLSDAIQAYHDTHPAPREGGS